MSHEQEKCLRIKLAFSKGFHIMFVFRIVNETYEANNIVEASNWWTSYVFVDFNKDTHAGSCNPAVFLNDHSEYRIVLFFELRLWGTKYIEITNLEWIKQL